MWFSIPKKLISPTVSAIWLKEKPTIKLKQKLNLLGECDKTEISK